MLQIEGLIFATHDVNFATLSKRFVLENTKVTLVAYDSDSENQNSLKQTKIHILRYPICLALFRPFLNSTMMCGIPINRNNAITKVSDSINLTNETNFILCEYNNSLNIKEFEIFLWKKRRFRLRWDSSPGLSIAGRLL